MFSLAYTPNSVQLVEASLHTAENRVPKGVSSPGTMDGQALEALEGFFCSPSFTSAIGHFMSENAPKLLFVSLDAEQPLQNFDLYMKYQQLVEEQLGSFLAEKGITQQEVCDTCKQAVEDGQAKALTCVDYLLASTEYAAFMQLAFDHAQLARYQPTAGALDDFELPPAEDDSEEVVSIGHQEDEAPELDSELPPQHAGCSPRKQPGDTRVMPQVPVV